MPIILNKKEDGGKLFCKINLQTRADGMCINRIFELSMVLDGEHFQKVFATACNKDGRMKGYEEKYVDTSLAEKGITVVYRDSQYKKKIQILVNTFLLVDDMADADKLVLKLNKRINGYFNHKYGLSDFIVSGMTLIADIDVGSRENVAAYLKVLKRIGRVKGYSLVSYDGIDEKDSLCLSGNSNGIDFLLYDLARGKRSYAQSRGVLRAEVRLAKPKAIRVYTNADDTAKQIADLTKEGVDIFMGIFARIIPYGEFHKKDAAMEILRIEIKDSIMRRKMLHLLTLIPAKKSLYLAQKAMNCRNVEKVMETFAKINLSPVTISKRHEVKKLENLYSYILK